MAVKLIANMKQSLMASFHHVGVHDAEPEPVNIEPVAESKASLEVAYEATQKEIESLKAQIAALKIHKFGLERLSLDNVSIKLYTGFLSYKHFYNFYHFVEPSAQHMKYVYPAGMQASRPSARNMLLIDELFLFLVRIRLGLFPQDLADRFSISTSTVSRKITTWANYLYFFLAPSQSGLLGSKLMNLCRKLLKTYIHHHYCFNLNCIHHTKAIPL